MDARTLSPPSASLARKKTRNQRFLHFQLQPRDEPHLDHLTENQRQLLLSDGTYQEKAQRFGLPVGTVRSRIHRGRAVLESLRQPNDGITQDVEDGQVH